MHHSHRTLRTDDRDFSLAVEEALQWVEEAEQLPKLSLVKGDDEEGSSDRLLDVPLGDDASGVEDLVLSQGGSEGLGADCEAAGLACMAAHRDDSPGEAEVFPVGDQSATEDLLLCESPEAETRMLQLSHDDSILHTELPIEATTDTPEEPSAAPAPNLPFRPKPAKTSTARPGKTPDRIGHGKLVAARLTWKPGDPFGDGRRRSVERFSWESMLTSACLTAACGLLCVWLLHSILA